MRNYETNKRVLVTGGAGFLGNPVEFNIRQVATKAIGLTGAKSTIQRLPLPSDDPLQRQPDVALVLEKLRWQPTVKLEGGLRRTVAHFDEMLTRAS